MARRSRNQNPLPLEAPVRVRLSDEDRARKGHELAVVGLSIRGHKRKLSNDARATKQEIARLEKERGDLEDALIADEELRPQGELFVADLPKDEAAAALASVAAAAGEVKPSEPHAFDPVTGTSATRDRLQCKVCGSVATDPVHTSRMESANTPTNETGEIAEPGPGNGKGRVHRTPGAKAAVGRARGKAARP